MPALARGQASDCTHPELDIFFRQDGGLIDIYSLSFIIFDIIDPENPTQVYPVAGKETVDVDNDCPTGHKLGTGHYVAEYTPELTEALGTHRTTWYYKPTDASAEQSWSEDFEVLAEVTPSSAVGYCTVADMRAEGVTVAQATDARLQTLIGLASKLIDKLCRQWFEPRSLTMTLDGRGSPTLRVGVPIIDVTKVSMDGTEIDSSTYVVYNRHISEELLHPDDRADPRIEFVSWGPGVVGDIYFFGKPATWPDERQNIEIQGVFGYTDPDGSQYGCTPTAIVHACKLMVMKQLPLMGNREARHEEMTSHRLLSVKTRDQSFTLAGPSASVGSSYLTGDEEIDQILEQYVSVAGIIGHV